MSEAPDPEKLRQIAEHRGLKLLKSRRRKPGIGDYGKFGLTDAAGKALLGIGASGLTASAEDIETWLRAGTLGTWQQSATATPDRVEAKPEPAPPETPETARSPKPKSRPTPRAATPKPPPAPKAAPPQPQLLFRPATPADADAIASLLSGLSNITIDSKTAQRNLAATIEAGGGLMLAELGKPIGCCGWTIIPTIHRGPVGRITAIIVAPNHRRLGIARKLLAAAEQALVEAGCTLVEAMSDIQIDNAHNFFRSLDFAQSSYRFTRELHS